MSILNRLVMIVLLLVIIVLVAVVAIAPEQSLLIGEGFLRWSRDGAADLQANDWPLFALGRVIVGGGLVLLCLILLWLELRRPRKKTIRVQKVAGGEVHITTDSVAQRLAYNLDQLPDVIKVSPRITGRARGMDIELLLETTPDIDVPMKTEEVLQVTREVVTERMGLKLGKVQVRIKHAPYPKE